MANEISININMTAVKGLFKERFQPGAKTYTLSSALSDAGVITASSNSTTITLNHVPSQAGYAFFANLSTAMEVHAGPTTTHWLRFPVEGIACVPFVGNPTICLETTANSAPLQYLILST